MHVNTHRSSQGPNPSGAIPCAHALVGGAGVLDAGDLIAGRFRVQQLLASGGMGDIYSGYCEASDRRVVLKVPRPLNGEGNGSYARFLQEVRATSLLRGEHVVHAVANGMLATGVPFLALEHLDGMDLGAVLRETGRLPVPLAVDYVRQACLGLCEVHALGLIHRDVKPANLFLAAHPTRPARIRLIDFGVAKWTSDAAADLSLTNASMLLGSAPYVSPEQLRDSASVDARTDIWALGVVLFELLMGARPFGGSSAADLCAQILMKPAPALRSERSEIAPELDAIVRRCLEKSRLDRFSSALELNDALRRFSSHAHPAPGEVSGRLALRRAVYRGADDGVSPFAQAPARSDEAAHTEWPSSHAPLIGAPALLRPRRSRWRYPIAAAITMLGATLLPMRRDSTPTVPSTLGTTRVQSGFVTTAAAIGTAAASAVSATRPLEVATAAADSSQRSEPGAAIDTMGGEAGVAASQRSGPNRASDGEGRATAPAPTQQSRAAAQQLPAVAQKPVPYGQEPQPAQAPKRPTAGKQPTRETHGSDKYEVDFGI